MKTALFCRVSSKEQEETGYSLPAQEKLLQDYAQNHSLTVVKVFAISESASGHKQREVFDSMLAFVKQNDIKVLTVEKVDRLTRSLRDAVKINEWLNDDLEREVRFVKENVILNRESRSNEKFIWNIKVSVAQYYIDNLSEEVKKGQREKIAQGWLPTKPPIGYKTVGEKGHRIHIINEEKAPLVRKMFELYATGNWSLKRLTDYMREEGLRNDNGNPLPKSRIHEHLTDPFYIGMNRWNGKVTPGNHEPLISKELLDNVRLVLGAKNTPKYSKHTYLFKGLVRCDECKGIITWEKQKGHVYGHCNHYRDCSQKTWSKQADIENQLLQEFGKLEIRNQRLADWIRKALKEVHKDEIEYYSSSISELNRQHKQAQQRLDRLYDDKLDGKITEEFYNRKFQEYSVEKQEAIQSIQKHSNANLKYYELGVNIFDLSQRAREIYQNAKSEDDKRALLKLVFGELTLNEGQLNISHAEPFKVLVEAVQLTNSSKTPHKERFAKNIFEPVKQTHSEPVKDTKRDPFGVSRPMWLRR